MQIRRRVAIRSVCVHDADAILFLSIIGTIKLARARQSIVSDPEVNCGVCMTNSSKAAERVSITFNSAADSDSINQLNVRVYDFGSNSNSTSPFTGHSNAERPANAASKSPYAFLIEFETESERLHRRADSHVDLLIQIMARPFTGSVRATREANSVYGGARSAKRTPFIL